MPRSALYKNIMRKKPNILLTDDEDTFRNIMAKELTRMGYNVVSCASGSETINTLHERDFDVVILDMNMPGKSGIEILHYIKCRSSYKVRGL